MRKKKIINCRTCGTEIAKNAYECPNCGAPNKRRRSNGGFADGCSVVLLLFIVFSVFIGIATFNSIFSDDTDAPSSEETTFIEISANKLWNAYNENTVSADDIYKNKNLSVTGKIKNIGQDLITDAPCVSLSAGDSYGIYSIQCFFPNSEEARAAVSSLKTGNNVTIKGKCTGEALGIVQLSKCSVN